MSVSFCSCSASLPDEPIQTQKCSNINKKRDLYSFLLLFFFCLFFFHLKCLQIKRCLGHRVDIHSFKVKENL